MKKTILAMAMAVAMLTGCATMGGNTGGLFGGIDGASVLGNVLGSVLGLNKITQENLVGTWRYAGPGCAFTSEQLLAKAGGEVVAGQIKTKVLPYYQQIGISAQNTYITINQDGTYSASFRGTPMSGRWTYDEASSRMSLQGLLLNLNCYAKRNMNGIALLFDASKLLTLLQTAAAMSGNQNIQAIGDISKSYDGVRLGFDFSR